MAQKELDKFDITNSKPLEEITNEDMTNIYTKLGPILERLGLTNLFEM